MATLSYIEIILKSNWGGLIDSLMTAEPASACAGASLKGKDFFCAAGTGRGSYRAKWSRNKEYFRFDGGIKGQDRQQMIDQFNKSKNSHLFLVSTKAGNMGSNLQVRDFISWKISRHYLSLYYCTTIVM